MTKSVTIVTKICDICSEVIDNDKNHIHINHELYGIVPSDCDDYDVSSIDLCYKCVDVIDEAIKGRLK